MKKIAAINFINHFFRVGLALALPLYMIEKSISLESIGFILSVTPFFMLLIRLVSAVVSETMGARIFFILQGISQSIAAFIYSVSTTPLLFGAGKIFEGVNQSFFWAVDRTAIFEDAKYDKKSRATQSAKMVVVRVIGGIFGILTAGIIITNFSFHYLFFLLIALGIITMLLSTMLRDTKHRKITVAKVIKLAKRNKFWKAGIGLGLNIAAGSVLFFFLIPVFGDLVMKLDYMMIGIIMAIFYVALVLGDVIAEKMKFREEKLMWIQIMGILFIAIIPFYTDNLVILLLLILSGISFGVAAAMFERVVSKIVGASPYISTDIAILHMPVRFIEFLALFSAGIIYHGLGAHSLFFLTAAMFGISAIMFKFYLKN